VQPRVPDAARYAHLGGDRRAVPAAVRDRADPRVRLHAAHRAWLEPVHLDVRVEDAVRNGPGPPAAGRDAFHLGRLRCTSFTTPRSTFSGGAGTRSSSRG